MKTNKCLRIIFFLLALSTVVVQAADLPTVENDLMPKGKALTLQFTEELRIGADGNDDRLLWTDAQTRVVPGPDGSMYISDPKENRVLLLNEKGTVLRQIGKAGEGPGEFQGLATFQVLADGSGIGLDGFGFHFFDKSGTFVERNKKRLAPAGFLDWAFYTPDGKHVGARHSKIDGKQLAIGFAILDTDLKVAQSITLFKAPTFDIEAYNAGGYWPIFLSGQFKPMARGQGGLYASDRNNNIYTAVANQYKITVYNADLSPKRVIRRKYKAIIRSEAEFAAMTEPIAEQVRTGFPPRVRKELTDAVIEKAFDLAEFPPAKQPISGLAVLDNDHLLVLHEQNYIKQTARFDIFNPEGVYIGHCQLPLSGAAKIVSRNGKLYTIETNSDGDNQVVRYGYKLVPARR